MAIRLVFLLPTLVFQVLELWTSITECMPAVGNAQVETVNSRMENYMVPNVRTKQWFFSSSHGNVPKVDLFKPNGLVRPGNAADIFKDQTPSSRSGSVNSLFKTSKASTNIENVEESLSKDAKTNSDAYEIRKGPFINTLLPETNGKTDSTSGSKSPFVNYIPRAHPSLFRTSSKNGEDSINVRTIAFSGNSDKSTHPTFQKLFQGFPTINNTSNDGKAIFRTLSSMHPLSDATSFSVPSLVFYKVNSNNNVSRAVQSHLTSETPPDSKPSRNAKEQLLENLLPPFDQKNNSVKNTQNIFKFWPKDIKANTNSKSIERLTPFPYSALSADSQSNKTAVDTFQTMFEKLMSPTAVPDSSEYFINLPESIKQRIEAKQIRPFKSYVTHPPEGSHFIRQEPTVDRIFKRLPLSDFGRDHLKLSSLEIQDKLKQVVKNWVKNMNTEAQENKMDLNTTEGKQDISRVRVPTNNGKVKEMPPINASNSKTSNKSLNKKPEQNQNKTKYNLIEETVLKRNKNGSSLDKNEKLQKKSMLQSSPKPEFKTNNFTKAVRPSENLNKYRNVEKGTRKNGNDSLTKGKVSREMEKIIGSAKSTSGSNNEHLDEPIQNLKGNAKRLIVNKETLKPTQIEQNITDILPSSFAGRKEIESKVNVSDLSSKKKVSSKQNHLKGKKSKSKMKAEEGSRKINKEIPMRESLKTQSNKVNNSQHSLKDKEIHGKPKNNITKQKINGSDSDQLSFTTDKNNTMQLPVPRQNENQSLQTFRNFTRNKVSHRDKTTHISFNKQIRGNENNTHNIFVTTTESAVNHSKLLKIHEPNKSYKSNLSLKTEKKSEIKMKRLPVQVNAVDNREQKPIFTTTTTNSIHQYDMESFPQSAKKESHETNISEANNNDMLSNMTFVSRGVNLSNSLNISRELVLITTFPLSTKKDVTTESTISTSTYESSLSTSSNHISISEKYRVTTQPSVVSSFWTTPEKATNTKLSAFDKDTVTIDTTILPSLTTMDRRNAIYKTGRTTDNKKKKSLKQTKLIESQNQEQSLSFSKNETEDKFYTGYTTISTITSSYSTPLGIKRKNSKDISLNDNIVKTAAPKKIKIGGKGKITFETTRENIVNTTQNHIHMPTPKLLEKRKKSFTEKYAFPISQQTTQTQRDLKDAEKDMKAVRSTPTLNKTAKELAQKLSNDKIKENPKVNKLGTEGNEFDVKTSTNNQSSKTSQRPQDKRSTKYLINIPVSTTQSANSIKITKNTDLNQDTAQITVQKLTSDLLIDPKVDRQTMTHGASIEDITNNAQNDPPPPIIVKKNTEPIVPKADPTYLFQEPRESLTVKDINVHSSSPEQEQRLSNDDIIKLSERKAESTKSANTIPVSNHNSKGNKLKTKPQRNKIGIELLNKLMKNKTSGKHNKRLSNLSENDKNVVNENVYYSNDVVAPLTKIRRPNIPARPRSEVSSSKLLEKLLSENIGNSIQLFSLPSNKRKPKELKKSVSTSKSRNNFLKGITNTKEKDAPYLKKSHGQLDKNSLPISILEMIHGMQMTKIKKDLAPKIPILKSMELPTKKVINFVPQGVSIKPAKSLVPYNFHLKLDRIQKKNNKAQYPDKNASQYTYELMHNEASSNVNGQGVIDHSQQSKPDDKIQAYHMSKIKNETRNGINILNSLLSGNIKRDKKAQLFHISPFAKDERQHDVHLRRRAHSTPLTYGLKSADKEPVNTNFDEAKRNSIIRDSDVSNLQNSNNKRKYLLSPVFKSSLKTNRQTLIDGPSQETSTTGLSKEQKSSDKSYKWFKDLNIISQLNLLPTDFVAKTQLFDNSASKHMKISEPNRNKRVDYLDKDNSAFTMHQKIRYVKEKLETDVLPKKELSQHKLKKTPEKKKLYLWGFTPSTVMRPNNQHLYQLNGTSTNDIQLTGTSNNDIPKTDSVKLLLFPTPVVW